MLTLTKIKSAIISFVVFAFVPFLAAAQSEGPAKLRILLEARLSDNTDIIKDGVEWRIFSSKPDEEGNIPELIFSHGGSKAFDIAPGEYLIHAAYGHASTVKRVKINGEAIREEFNFNAGGLKLQATAADDVRIPPRMLRFDVYEQKIRQNGTRKLLARDISAGEVIPFPVGTYHIVSRFGDLNATVRADIRVEPGKLTVGSLTHRAAIVSFRLVRSNGGDAVANTAWSILTENGEVVDEIVRTFPSMVLSEGNYTAIAKHNEKVYSHDFKVRSGFNEDVEVLIVN